MRLALRFAYIATGLWIGLSVTARADQDPCPPTVDPPQPAVPAEAEQLLDRFDGLKSEAELHEYLRVQFRRPPNPKYIRFIQRASQAFDLPVAFLSCLFAKESNWNPRLKSPIGAAGIAQLNTDALEDISRILNEDRGISDGPDLEERWRAYWSSLNVRVPPKELTTDEAMKAQIGIAAGALWAKYYEYRLDSTITHPPDMDALVMIAGAYNLGVGGFARICGGLSLDDCLARLRKRKYRETYSHMVAIQSCMQSGNLMILQPADRRGR